MSKRIRPLFKWLIGRVREEGYDCLSLSMENAWCIYGSQVDYSICYNNIERTFLEERVAPPAGMDVSWVDQTRYRGGVATEYGWKFYPFKIQNDRRELWLDNDIVLFDRHPLVDEFLFGGAERFLFAEDIQRAYSPRSIDERIPEHLKICAGLVGIPAFPIQSILRRFRRLLATYGVPDTETHFTCRTIGQFGVENATVALLCMAYPGEFLLIDHDDIPVGKAIRDGRIGRFGMHFNGLNRGPKPEIAMAFRMLAESPDRPRRPGEMPSDMLRPNSREKTS